ncbi:hypothetical protein Athai_40030 [Actinocatenispora thailandica]|uniref:Adhesin domain-containing protein n=1 Tax=Actinocatenispora thailandica TaxID=227318 RepID=A0A7R7DRX2_9ACTN|nr:DUF4097 family beta strand repeat-containing protein [Actinocatenispora thailandica]BCJ36500.1 hypothetical protein Athai_40030 [Actinocatenispora thailandica]
MPSYDTPEPISVTADLFVGNLTVHATDRTSTVVEVVPTDPNDESNVRAAEQARVEYADGVLRIRSTRLRNWISWSNKTWSIDVTIQLPTGSAVRSSATMGDVVTTGTLGDCQVKSGTGRLRLERTGALRARTVGDIDIGRIDGTAEVSTGSGTIRIGALGGNAVVKNSNGMTEIDAITGDAQVRSSNGNITIGDAGGSVQARTAAGSVQIERAIRGRVDAETGFGNLRIGLAHGSAAKLDLETKFGRIDNTLDSSDGPAPSDEVVTVRCRTSYGEIALGRA